MNRFLEKIRFFPLPMFAVVMGFSGLSIVFERASALLGFSPLYAYVFSGLDTLLFAVILALYATKAALYFDEVKRDFLHKIKINFFAAISISFLLISLVWHGIFEPVSFYLFAVGLALHTFLTFYTVSFWINNSFEIQHSNPAWFIPIVGNVLVPLAGEGFASNALLGYYFFVGMFFWVVLFTITFYRIIFHSQLPIKFMPTLFILIAPPAVGFVAYEKLTNAGFDFFGQFMYSLALFFTILIAFMHKNFLKLKFFISWWAFTFPAAAITIATLLAYKITQAPALLYLSYALIFTTCVIVAFVSFHTLKYMLRGEICVKESD